MLDNEHLDMLIDSEYDSAKIGDKSSEELSMATLNAAIGRILQNEGVLEDIPLALQRRVGTQILSTLIGINRTKESSSILSKEDFRQAVKDAIARFSKGQTDLDRLTGT